MSRLTHTVLAVLATTVAVVVLADVYAMLNFGGHRFQAPAGVPVEVVDSFNIWKQAFGKAYGSSNEETARLNVFHQNYNKIQSHRQNANRTYELDMNQFMDLTPVEFKALFLSTHVPETTENREIELTNDAADEIDWRLKGVVTDVKDQGMCGSCWAFSTTGSLEAAANLAGKGNFSFSEQQLVDCSTSYGNNGCNGGLMDDGFKFVKDHGITTEDKYPYKAVDQKCKIQGGDFKISTWVDVKKKNVDQLAKAVNI